MNIQEAVAYLEQFEAKWGKTWPDLSDAVQTVRAYVDEHQFGDFEEAIIRKVAEVFEVPEEMIKGPDDEGCYQLPAEYHGASVRVTITVTPPDEETRAERVARAFGVTLSEVSGLDVTGGVYAVIPQLAGTQYIVDFHNDTVVAYTYTFDGLDYRPVVMPKGLKSALKDVLFGGGR